MTKPRREPRLRRGFLCWDNPYNREELPDSIPDGCIRCLRELGDKASDSLVASLKKFLSDEYDG